MRVINGSTARNAQFPWMAKLELYYSLHAADPYTCGASIITRRHVLTAAHCMIENGRRAVRTDVVYGHADVQEASRVPVSNMLIHESYNDIAILLVAQPFRFSPAVRPLCLQTRRMDLVNRKAVAAGWGRTQQGKTPGTDDLQYTILKIVSNNVCRSYFPMSYDPRTMLCARCRYSTVCLGDSGGPLFIKSQHGRFVQVGIASFIVGNMTCCTSKANVFTRVGAYTPWIKEAIAKLRAHGYFT
ncbi:chymotrypsinogen B-like [Amblyomma americanum]